jgi:hypothetical protein
MMTNGIVTLNAECPILIAKLSIGLPSVILPSVLEAFSLVTVTILCYGV